MTENLHALSSHGPQFPGTLDLTGLRPRFKVLNSPGGPDSFSFNGLTGGPGLISLVLEHFKGLPPTE